MLFDFASTWSPALHCGTSSWWPPRSENSQAMSVPDEKYYSSEFINVADRACQGCANVPCICAVVYSPPPTLLFILTIKGQKLPSERCVWAHTTRRIDKYWWAFTLSARSSTAGGRLGYTRYHVHKLVSLHQASNRHCIYASVSRLYVNSRHQPQYKPKLHVWFTMWHTLWYAQSSAYAGA